LGNLFAKVPELEGVRRLSRAVPRVRRSREAEGCDRAMCWILASQMGCARLLKLLEIVHVLAGPNICANRRCAFFPGAQNSGVLSQYRE